ncbi:MAG: hypothetical protein OXI45_03520, partial [Acidobacteriota bacterium]|nr:hypothetical protein [Acidobacteriota bacterium]
PGTWIAYDSSEMRGFLLVASSLLLAPAAYAQDADNTARVLEVTLADLDEDALDFLIGWERWKGDILELASEGSARFTFAPLIAVAPGLPADGRFGRWTFGAALQRALPRSASARRPERARSPRPVRIARTPRGAPAERGRPRSPRGLPPLGLGASRPPPRTGGARPAPRRGVPALGGPPRGGKRGGAGAGPTGRARPRGASGTRNPRRHR